jgi:hypothetical protein
MRNMYGKDGVNLLKLVAGVSWGTNPSCLILLYKRLNGSILEYGSVCFRFQYRALRIALGLMGS